MVGNEKGHPVGCPVLLVFGGLALVRGDSRDQLLEVSLDEAGLVEGDQSAPVDALSQLIRGRLDLMGGELSHGVVQGPKVAGLVFAVRGVVPDDLDLVHVAVSDHLGPGEVVEDNMALLVLDAAVSEAGEELGAILEALDGTGHNVHKARNVELVRVLLSETELILQGLETVGADEAKDAHLKRNATRAVEGVVEGQTQAQIVAHLGQLDQLVLEIVLNVDSRTVTDDVTLAGEVAQLVVRESVLNRVEQGAVLHQRVAFRANAQHLLGVGAAIRHPARSLALGGHQGDRLDRVVEAVAGASGGGGGRGDIDLGHKCDVDVDVELTGQSLDGNRIGRKSLSRFSSNSFRPIVPGSGHPNSKNYHKKIILDNLFSLLSLSLTYLINNKQYLHYLQVLFLIFTIKINNISAIKKPPLFRRLVFIICLGILESNQYLESQSLPHYHYANPQLQKNPLVIYLTNGLLLFGSLSLNVLNLTRLNRKNLASRNATISVSIHIIERNSLS